MSPANAGDGGDGVFEEPFAESKGERARETQEKDTGKRSAKKHVSAPGCAQALIEAKADPLLRDRGQGLTALDFAQRGRDWDAGPNEEAIKAPERIRTFGTIKPDF